MKVYFFFLISLALIIQINSKKEDTDKNLKDAKKLIDKAEGDLKDAAKEDKKAEKREKKNEPAAYEHKKSEEKQQKANEEIKGAKDKLDKILGEKDNKKEEHKKEHSEHDNKNNDESITEEIGKNQKNQPIPIYSLQITIENDTNKKSANYALIIQLFIIFGFIISLFCYIAYTYSLKYSSHNYNFSLELISI